MARPGRTLAKATSILLYVLAGMIVAFVALGVAAAVGTGKPAAAFGAVVVTVGTVGYGVVGSAVPRPILMATAIIAIAWYFVGIALLAVLALRVLRWALAVKDVVGRDA